ncbi:huntingtin-interacting protein K-like [Nycticebus coucang]|uniref:huntingtin-interacting protein K-like n=1 Tax=Nycticebus coucang TaxID=9470 RepID=UPI00234D16DD|nr:huntingtin-interacting protein K-like [Nycticebus coucang]
MATEGDVELELETDQRPRAAPEKPGTHDSDTADLGQVTNYVEEEIQSSNVERTMSITGDRWSREKKAKQEQEKELAKVTIKKEDQGLAPATYS